MNKKRRAETEKAIESQCVLMKYKVNGERMDAFIKGVAWADANPDPDRIPSEAELEQTALGIRDTLNNYRLSKALEVAKGAMNKLAIAQSGALDYTDDFYELCKQEIRSALANIERIEREE